MTSFSGGDWPGVPEEAFGGHYFDHAAMSPLRAEARHALVESLTVVGNPASLHRAAQRARRRLEEAREELAAAVGAHPTSVVFTSGGSEANTIAVLGALRSGRHRMLVSAIEHPSVLGAVARGAELLPVTPRGVVDLQSLPVITDDVAVVSVMHVNNETGLLQPIGAVRDLAHWGGAWFHTDAVQSLGHISLDFDAMDVDMMTLAAHKVGGPVGIGALLLRRGVEPGATGLGGGQERDIRSGTSAVALAAAFAAAATAAASELDASSRRLTLHQQRIAMAVRDIGGEVNTFLGPHAPHIVNVTFPGLRASDLLFLLDTVDIAASVGSACRAGVHQPSEVMLAMGRDADSAAATVRFSLGHDTTDDDVEVLLSHLPGLVERARSAFA